MLNFGASKPRVRGGPGPRGPPWIRTWKVSGFCHKTEREKNCKQKKPVVLYL